uniref:Uncharacterized protein n=1 Tax=Cacopsylla melanoneura TaxID=428564 RepID=A0A8D8SFT1_9HEMI
MYSRNFCPSFILVLKNRNLSKLIFTFDKKCLSNFSSITLYSVFIDIPNGSNNSIPISPIPNSNIAFFLFSSMPVAITYISNFVLNTFQFLEFSSVGTIILVCAMFNK